MAQICKISDVRNPLTKLGGFEEIIQSCKIIKDSKNRGGKSESGSSKFPDDFIDVFTLYEQGYVALPTGYARRAVSTLKFPAVTPEIPEGIIRGPLPAQGDILSLLLKYLIETGGALLECDPGMGKTFMSLFAAFMFAMPAVVVVPRADYAGQWAEEALKIMPGIERHICLMGSLAEISTKFPATPETAKLLFIRAANLEKIELDVLRRYRFVILDETQMLGTKKSIECILRLTNAAYVVGCSATPDKPDGRERAMELFMGSAVIEARRDRKFDLVLFPLAVKTDEAEYDRLLRGGAHGRKKSTTGLSHMGEYGRMEISIAKNFITNHRIAILCACLVKMHNHKVIVLTKYLNQAAYLSKILTDWKISSTIYSGSNKEYDGFASVTIGINQVAVAAFDQAKRPHDRRFTAGIMLQSLSQEGNMWQAIGRVMRAPDEIRPLFIWAQYPMNAYSAHVNTVVPFLTSRSGELAEPSTLIPEDILKDWFGREIQIPICTVVDERDLQDLALEVPDDSNMKFRGPAPRAPDVTRQTVGKFDISAAEVYDFSDFFRPEHQKYLKF